MFSMRSHIAAVDFRVSELLPLATLQSTCDSSALHKSVHVRKVILGVERVRLVWFGSKWIV
jgi:hypothetical protein